MLRSTFYSFTTALRGMRTAQKQLDVTGQNISNANTTGYTRQRADIYSAVPAGYGDRYATSGKLVGQGVVVERISQCRDQFLDVRFRRESANLGEQEAKLGVMNDLSLVFDEIENEGLMTSFSNLVTQLQNFANNAESPEFDSIVRDAAQNLANQFNYYANQLATVREEAEYNIKEITVGTINDLLTNIAALNKSIQEVQSGGGSALELKDERNLLLDELSNYMKIDVRYEPETVAGGIVIEDVTVSMVGADGSKQPLVYNDTCANLQIQTPGQDGTYETIVTIDNSAIPAEKAVDLINNLLRGVAAQNGQLQSLKKSISSNATIMGLLKNDDGTDFDIDGATTDELLTKLEAAVNKANESVTGTGGLNEQIEAKNQEIADLKTQYEEDIKDKTADEIKTIKEAYDLNLANARKELNALKNQRTDVLLASSDLSNIYKDTKKAANSLKSYDEALKNKLAEYGVTAKQYWNPVGDYSTCYYAFEDNAGNKIEDADGNEIQWKVGKTIEKVDRQQLENELGITFTDNFDAEAFGSPGALKGAIDMLNSKGVFDYEANEIRGIGYYESMLDTLANQLATTMNSLNDMKSTNDVLEYLFETSDGSSEFTAKNIKISSGWLNGEYGITNTQQVAPGGNNAQNDNIMLMISTISTRLEYGTGPIAKQDQNGNYLDADGNIVANGRDSDGNYILTTKNANGTETVKKIANKDFIAYDTNGVLKADTLSTYTGNVYQDADGNLYTDGNEPADATKYTDTVYVDKNGDIVANGRDAYGNYTMTTTDADGNKTVKTIANSDGVMYELDANGDVVKDANGTKQYQNATMSDIAHRAESFLYNGTYQEFLANIANVLSLDVSSTSNLSENHSTILEEIQTSKDSISSVSLDEEGVNILQFQKAYNAAARLMTALDEAVERIINQMGTVGR
ncbi:MAG: flagellar basal body protein [Anaerovoracaceae bacterium]